MYKFLYILVSCRRTHFIIIAEKATSHKEDAEQMNDRLGNKMKLRGKATAPDHEKDPSKNASKIKRTVNMNWSHYDESIKGLLVGQGLVLERTFINFYKCRPKSCIGTYFQNI